MGMWESHYSDFGVCLFFLKYDAVMNLSQSLRLLSTKMKITATESCQAKTLNSDISTTATRGISYFRFTVASESAECGFMLHNWAD